MAGEENTKSLDDEIQGVIRTNQTLLRKKGLLKRLLEDSAIKNLLNHVLDSDKRFSDKEKLLSDEEMELLQYLSDNEFNLDKTIEKMVGVASKKMASELINDKIMEDIETSSQPDEEIPQPDEGPSQAEDDIELGLKGDKGNRSLHRGHSKINIVQDANYKILTQAIVRTEAALDSAKKEDLKKGQIVKVIGSQDVKDPRALHIKIKRVKVEYEEGVGWISTVSSEGAHIIKKVSDDGDDSDADADGGDQDEDEDADADGDEDAEAQAQAQAAAPAPAPAPAQADADDSDAGAEAPAPAPAQAAAPAPAPAQAEADAAQLENMQQAIVRRNELAGGAE